MKSIKGKLYFVYLLIFLALVSTVFSSYVAVDTNNQHLMLSELLAAQRLNVEKVILITNNLSELRIANESLFNEHKSNDLILIDESYKNVEEVLNTFQSREYIFDGKERQLKFKGEFETIFVKAVNEAEENWMQAKSEIEELIYVDMVTEAYIEKANHFEMMNLVLISDVDLITKLCRDEAEKQRKIANILQMIALSIVIIIFVWLIFFIKKDIQNPIFKIRKVFRKMGSGDFNVSLNRKNDDEFKLLFEDFNQFIENRHTIARIEDHILGEDNLRAVLSEMLNDFKSFVSLTHIDIVYTDSFSNYKKISTHNPMITQMDVLKKYDKIVCEDDQSLIMPITVNNVYLGYSVFNKDKKFSDKDVKFVSGLEKKISFAFYKSLIFKDLLRIVTSGLADLTESRDPETKRHLDRMSLYSQIIAKRLFIDGDYTDIIDSEFIENIQLTAPMHDIGKVAVPDHILLKPGKLTEEEFECMKTHASEGAKVLKAINTRFSTYNIHYFKMAQDIANYHQEKFDGSGYPEGVAGDEIPLCARISTVADVFDALTSKRPYKEAFSLEKSYNILKDSIGTHFDPRLIQAFFDSQDEIEAVYFKYREI